MLNYEFPPLGGGASPVSYEIAKGYSTLGHQVDVVTMAYGDLPHYEQKEGFNIYRVPCLRRKKETCEPWEQATYIWATLKFLRKHLRTHVYDINHTHFIIPTGIISLWIKRKYSLPYVITSHGSDVPGYNPDRFTVLHRFTKPILRKVCKNALCITTPSQYLADLIREKIGEYRTLVIPNGSKDLLDTGVQKENIIVSAGRFLPRKGFHLLIEAFQAINPGGWRLYLVGDGPFRDDLKALADGNPNIVFTGWLDNSGKEFKEILNKAKIFALLSSRETQGIAFIEAMSTGCAILTSDLTACKETVSEDCGVLIDISNPQEIKCRLRESLENSHVLERLMNNSRIKFESEFRYDGIIKRYENTMMSIIQI